MNEGEETEGVKHSPSTPTCCKDRPCPIVSQYQLDAPVTQDTRHLCLTKPHPHPLPTSERVYFKRKAFALFKFVCLC